QFSGGRRQVGGVAAGRTAGHPVRDELLLLVAQARVVGELAVLRVGVPGRHALLADHLGDRLRPARRLLVAGQRERRDLAGPVADETVLLEDGGDVPAVGDRTLRRRAADAVDAAAGHRRLGLADGFAG